MQRYHAVSSSSRSLVFIFDSDMSFSDQINSAVSKSFHFFFIRYNPSIEFIISLLGLQPHLSLLQIHLSPSTVTFAIIHYIIMFGFHKQISTSFNAFKTPWHLSLQTLQNFNTLHNTNSLLWKIHWLPINQWIDINSVFSHTKSHIVLYNLHIFTVIFHFHHIMCLYKLIWLNSSFHFLWPLSKLLLKNEHFPLLMNDSGTNSPWVPSEIHPLPIFRSKLETHLFEYTPVRKQLECLGRFSLQDVC